MRDIKFRIFDKVRKTMVTNLVSYLLSVNDDGSLNSVGGHGDNPIMQFTGLRDKNGNEIYEGDIVVNTGNESHPKEIDFFNGFWSMKSPGIRIVPDWSDTSDIEIIGSIYENPELL